MLLFYIIFVILFITVRILRFSNMIVLVFTGAIAVCESAMFFMAGRDMAKKRGSLSEAYKSRAEYLDSFRIFAGKRALALFSLYAVLGVPCLWLFKDQGIYQSVRNIIAFNNVPDLCGILASLAFLYILAAAFLPWYEGCKKKKLAVILISLAGFLMVFIPRRILGYALIGIFIGGDKFGCVPIATHLISFFWGAYTVSPGNMSLKDKWNLLVLLFLGAVSVVTGLLRLRHAFFLSAGSFCAFFAVGILSLIFPLFEKLKPPADRILGHLKNSVVSLDQPAGGRILSKANAGNLVIYFLGYTALFLLTAFFIFLPIIQMGKSLVWTGDALAQYIPKLHRFLRYIPQVWDSLSHGDTDFLQYDYGSGLGSTMSITFEPIYWLYLILPKGNIDAVYTFLHMLRFYLAGLSFSLLAIYFRRSWLASWTASMAYTFSGFALFAGTRHFTFIAALILLPLLVVGMERLIRYKKWYMFTVAVALSLLCSYYFLYMNTIVLGFYYIARILCTKEYRNFKTFFTRGLIIVGSYLLGCSMGVLSIATHFGSYLSSGRSEGSKLARLLSVFSLFYRDGWISDLFLSSMNYTFTPGYWLKIGTVPLALFGAIFLFTKKNRKELRIMFCLLTAFCIFPVAAFVFSGFSTITNRWTYIFSLLTAFLAALCLDQMQNLTRKDVLVLTGVTLYYGLIVYFDERIHFQTMFADLAFLALTLCLILLISREDIPIPSYAGKIMVGAFTILILIFNGTNYVTEYPKGGHDLRINYTKFNSLERLSRTSIRDLDQIPEYKNSDEFFRCTTMRGSNETNCFSLVNGHNDLSTFSSTLTGSIVDYNRMMGNCDWTIVRMLDYNFRTIMNGLASVKYLGVRNHEFDAVIPYGYKPVYTTEDGLPIYENQYPLPLGYTYDTITPDSAALKESAVTRQELTLNTAIIDDDVLDECKNLKQQSSVPLLSHEIPYEAKYDGVRIQDNMMYFDKEGATIKLTFESEPNSETYVVYSGDITEIDEGNMDYRSVIIKTDEIWYKYAFRTDTYMTGQDQYVFNLGYHKKKGAVTSCTLKFKLIGSINFDKLSVYSQPMDGYADSVAARREDILEHENINNNTITGDIDLDTDKMLVITLPYQSGWTAYVDGKEVPIYRANYQYMGLNLTKGRHDIRLHYQIGGLKRALQITCAGLALFLVIILFNFLRKRIKKGK